MRVAPDTNIFDLIIDEAPGAAELLAAIGAGRIELLVTHAQRDELGAVADGQRRDRLLAVPFKVQPTAGAIWGVSKWGACEWGDGQGVVPAVVGASRRRACDALIASTAAREGIPLVTMDAQLAKRAGEVGLAVWGWAELVQATKAILPCPSPGEPPG